MRRFRYLLLALAAVCVLGALALWPLLKTDSFWTWGGRRLVDFARSRIYGEIEVQQVRGNHLTGLTFRGVTVQGRQGEVLRAATSGLAFFPLVFCEASAGDRPAGHPRPPPHPQPGPARRLECQQLLPPQAAARLSTPSIFPKSRSQGGEMDPDPTRGQPALPGPGPASWPSPCCHPKRPQQAILVRRASLTGNTPWGPLGLQTRFTYGSNSLTCCPWPGGGRPAPGLLGRRSALRRKPVIV